MTAVVPAKPDLPAACADCITTFKSSIPGADISKTPSKWARDAQGRLRFDYPDMSVISDPASQKSVLLDHLKKEAKMIEPPPLPTLPNGLPMPPKPEIPKPPDIQKPDVQELGKRFIDGVEAEGKRYIVKPNVPQMPNMPTPPEPPDVMEIWTGTQNKLPILTMIKGKFGEQMCHCKYSGPEPPASMFQIPPDYKLVPSAPPAPQAPGLPTAPKFSAPSMPNAPSLPNMAVPKAPAPPSAPSAPSMPSAPKPPGFKF